MAKKKVMSKGIDFVKLAAKSAARGPNNHVVLDEDGFEVLGGGSGQEIQVGEVVEGVFAGIARSMPGRKKGTSVPFYQVGARQLLGGTVLKSRIEEGKVQVGDYLRVTRLEDAPKKRGQNPAKLYDVRVKRAK